LTKADLVQQIEAYSHRDDLSAEMDGFISDATARLSLALRSREQESFATITPTSNPGSLPADFAAIRSISYPNNSGTVVLDPVGQRNRGKYAQSGAYTLGYGIHGSLISFYPFSARSFDLEYFARIPALDTDESTNLILENFPYLYRNTALISLYQYTVDEAEMQRMFGLVEGDAALINKEAMRARMGTTAAAGVS
jgi:hypothetical protein